MRRKCFLLICDTYRNFMLHSCCTTVHILYSVYCIDFAKTNIFAKISQNLLSSKYFHKNGPVVSHVSDKFCLLCKNFKGKVIICKLSRNISIIFSLKPKIFLIHLQPIFVNLFIYHDQQIFSFFNLFLL